MQKPVAPQVDLTQISLLTEIVIRAGNTGDPQNRRHTQRAYEPDDRYSNGVVGLSVVFHVGATLDELAKRAAFPNRKISYTAIGVLLHELALFGCEPVLFVTPTSLVPDHHTLAIARGGVIEVILANDALDALLRSLIVVDNPYQRLHP